MRVAPAVVRTEDQERALRAVGAKAGSLPARQVESAIAFI